MKSLHTKNIAILGAWPAGMSTAYELCKNWTWEYEIDIYEASDRVGWLAWSFLYNGQIVDFGPHRFFSKLEMPNNMRDEILGEDSVMVKRLTRMYYEWRFYNYPVDLANVVKTMPFWKLVKIWLSYIYAKLFPIQDDSNYENRVINMFGRELYLTFFKYYNEKLRWVPSKELWSDRVKQRIRWVSVSAILKKWRNGLIGRGNTMDIKSRVDEFKYPKYGNWFFYESIKKILDATWMVTFYFNTKVDSIIKDWNGWLVNWTYYDEVISSIPIDMFFAALQSTPSSIATSVSQLRFRWIMLVYATLDEKDIFPDNRIYLHSTISGRMTNFNNRSPYQIQNKEKTYVVMEYRDNPGGDLRNTSDEELCNLAKEEIHSISKVDISKIHDFKIIRLPHGYPILMDGYNTFLNMVQEYAKSLDHMQLIGRSWSFKYNNQDHSLYMWYLAARNIIEWTTRYDLRTVNSDEEYHEEE